jgi:hypothetical protein
LKEHNVIATGRGKTLTKLALLAGAMLLAVACGKSGGGSDSVCGMEFSDTEFCAQTGTNGQGTKCEKVEDNGNTCINPEIRWGDTIVGIPSDDDPFFPNTTDLDLVQTAGLCGGLRGCGLRFSFMRAAAG